MHKLLGQDKLIVGYDLGNDYSQISYCMAGDDQVETLSLVTGAEVFSIPTVLCKREKVNQWFFGKEALRYVQENQGVLVDDLLKLAIDGEEVRIEGKIFDPVALLALFFKRSLGLLSQVAGADKIGALMITCSHLDSRLLEVLAQVVSGLKLKTEHVYFQGHMESFYNYMIHQPEDLWSFQTILCDYRQDKMNVYCMECNKRTTPVVAFMESKTYDFISYEPMPDAERLRREKMERMDKELLKLVTEVCQGRIVSAVYLIGEGFTEEWLKESLRFLCKSRRVFQGNNLFSKGACYGMMERLESSEVGRSHVFLGSDKLKANIGMKILRKGEESYYALLDAGTNWFEAEDTCECYIREDNTLEFVITPLIGKNVRQINMILDELQEGVSRLRVHLYLQNEHCLVIEVEDLGFGEFRPPSGRTWKEEIELYC